MPESHIFPEESILLFQVGFGLFWLVAYLLIIILGAKDKYCGMPFVCFCVNISWEFTFAFVFPHHAPQVYINYLWILFDVAIGYQLLKYGRKDLPAGFPKRMFIPLVVITLAVSLMGNVTITQEFNDLDGKYTGFGANFLMSIMFVWLLIRRNSIAGQSLYVAISKMIGTMFASLLFYSFYPESTLFLYIYLTIVLFDLIYIVMLYKKFKECSVNPWTHRPYHQKEELQQPRTRTA